MEMEKITINGKTYVPEEMAQAQAVNTEGMRYVIVRTYSAGVHIGYLADQSEDGKRVKLIDSRRVWYWRGAFTLSEISHNGVSDPDNCKFSIAIPEIDLTEAIEIIPCTENAMDILKAVKAYDAK